MTGSGIGYDPTIKGERHTFGVSGKLYRRNVLLYDHQTESLWSQILRKAVAGPLTDVQLSPIPLLQTTWKDWKKKHPDTLVLSTDTGHHRDYQLDPYGIAVPRALGVLIGNHVKVYSFSQLRNIKKFPLKDQVGKESILIYFDETTAKAWATDEKGKPVDYFVSYLDAWKTFYPHAETFKFSK